MTNAQPTWMPGPAQQLTTLRSLHAVTKSVHASLDLTQTLNAVTRGVVQGTGFGAAAVNLAEPGGGYRVVSVAGPDEARDALLGTTSTDESWGRLFERAQAWGSLYFVDHRHGLPEEMRVWSPDQPASDDPLDWHPQDALFAPLTASSDDWVGVLSVDLPVDGRRPGPEQREILELFADHAALAILHARMHSELQETRGRLEHLATHDILTGLPNRTRLRSWVEELMQTPDCPIGVLAIDLDGFKRVNDSAGHDAGDEVLQVLAERMGRQVREGDLLARIGGDEFVVVLSGPDTPRVLPKLADRLQQVVSEPVLGRSGRHQVGASIGSALAITPTDFGELLRSADAQMYRRKAAVHLRDAAEPPA